MMAPFGAAMISAIMVNSLANFLLLLSHYFIFMVAVSCFDLIGCCRGRRWPAICSGQISCFGRFWCVLDDLDQFDVTQNKGNRKSRSEKAKSWNSFDILG